MSNESNLVSSYFASNPLATPQQVANAVQSIGGLTPALSSALASYYGTSADNIGQQYQALTAPAPVAPLSVPSSTVSSAPPPTPATPQNNPYASTGSSVDLSGFRTASQVLSGLQSGALTPTQAQSALGYVASTPMGTSSGGLPSYVNASVAPAPLSLSPQPPTPYSSQFAPATASDTNPYFNQTYNALQLGNTKITTVDNNDTEGGGQKLALVDAKGNPLPPDNIVDYGNGIYDLQIGSGAGGGRNHILVKVDPKTGYVTPVENYNQQVNYQGGDKGGFLNQTAKGFSSLPGVNMAVAIMAPELYPYLQGMNALNSYNNNDILGALNSGFGAYTGLTGNNPLLTNKGIEQVNTSGLSSNDIKNINTGLSVGTALRDKNYASLFNTAMQQTDTKLPNEVGAGLKLASAFNAYSKGDYKALMNSMIGFVNSTDPKVATSAQKTIADINNGVDGKVALNNFTQNVGIPSDVASIIASLSPDQLAQSGYGNTVTTTAGLATDQNPLSTPFTKSDAYDKAYEKLIASGMSDEDASRIAKQTADATSGTITPDTRQLEVIKDTGQGAKLGENGQMAYQYHVRDADGNVFTAMSPAELKVGESINAKSIFDVQPYQTISTGTSRSINGGGGNTPVTGTSEPQITTDPETGITTAVEDINGSKVTNIIYPNSNNTKQISENADGTRQETTSDGVNKTIKEYDADGNLISESIVPVKPTNGKDDENIHTINVIARPDPIIAIPSGGTPSTTATTPVVPTAPVVPPVPPTPPAPPPAPPPQPPAPPPVAPPVAPVAPVVVPSTPVSVPTTPITIPPTTKTPTPTVSGGALPTNMPTNFGGHTPNPIVESLLKTYMTKQAFKDPLASLQKLVQEQQKSENSMIDPRLASILQQRSAPQDTGYYKYGQEPTSVEDILSLKDSANQTYKTGGHVQPLAHLSGGALPVVNNRHDFRQGAHVAGEGDGTSDDIPAMLADGEFVFPADVVSALGNGSTKAGTDKLYEMMHSIRARARKAHPSDLPPNALKSPLDYLKGRKK
jgi:hypothetical protein